MGKYENWQNSKSNFKIAKFWFYELKKDLEIC